MSDIVVVYALLDTLEHHARATADALDEASHLMNLEFTGTPELTAAYADFIGRWDRHRDELRVGIVTAADALLVVRGAFSTLEDQLISVLGG